MSVLLVKQPSSVSEPPFGERMGNAIHPYLVGKLVVDFL